MSDININPDPDPIDLPEGNVSAEELDSWVNSHLDTESSPPGSEVEQKEELPAPSPSAPSDVVDEELIRLSDDLALSKAEARTLYDLSQELQRNPELTAAIASYYEARRNPASVTAPTPEPPPLPIDLQDPATKWFYDQQQQALTEIKTLRSELESRTGTIADVIQQRQIAENNSIISRVKDDFKSARNLSDAEVSALASAAANLQILPGLLNSGLDLYTATERALDTAYWSNPDFRQRAINTQAEQTRQDTTRKRKLAAVGGSSGSSPRSSPKPKTEEEARQMMISEVAQLMAGDG